MYDPSDLLSVRQSTTKSLSLLSHPSNKGHGLARLCRSSVRLHQVQPGTEAVRLRGRKPGVYLAENGVEKTPLGDESIEHG
jgi:hypothetical protein